MTLRFPFSTHGIESLTPFIQRHDSPAELSVLGKFTHPSGAPDNHLLTAWAPGSV